MQWIKPAKIFLLVAVVAIVARVFARGNGLMWFYPLLVRGRQQL